MGAVGVAVGVALARVRCVASLRPDTVFLPFHYGGEQAANLVTNPALDPISGMPEFTVCAVRLEAGRGVAGR